MKKLSEEPKDFLSGIMERIKETTEKLSEGVKDFFEGITGKKGEGEASGISKIIQDVHSGIKDLLGLETAEGEGGFDISSMVTKARNSIRELLGMEPLAE